MAPWSSWTEQLFGSRRPKQAAVGPIDPSTPATRSPERVTRAPYAPVAGGAACRPGALTRSAVQPDRPDRRHTVGRRRGFDVGVRHRDEAIRHQRARRCADAGRRAAAGGAAARRQPSPRRDPVRPRPHQLPGPEQPVTRLVQRRARRHQHHQHPARGHHRARSGLSAGGLGAVLRPGHRYSFQSAEDPCAAGHGDRPAVDHPVRHPLIQLPQHQSAADVGSCLHRRRNGYRRGVARQHVQRRSRGLHQRAGRTDDHSERLGELHRLGHPLDQQPGAVRAVLAAGQLHRGRGSDVGHPDQHRARRLVVHLAGPGLPEPGGQWLRPALPGHRPRHRPARLDHLGTERPAPVEDRYLSAAAELPGPDPDRRQRTARQRRRLPGDGHRSAPGAGGQPDCLDLPHGRSRRHGLFLPERVRPDRARRPVRVHGGQPQRREHHCRGFRGP